VLTPINLKIFQQTQAIDMHLIQQMQEDEAEYGFLLPTLAVVRA